MEDFLYYIGKVAIAAGVFYIAFLLLFQNRKHFVFNRIYLPVSLLISFLIPLITFTTVKYVEPVNFDVNSLAYLGNTTGGIQPTGFEFEWYHYLYGMYILGISVFTAYLFLGHLKAIQIIRKSRIQQLFENIVNITQKDIHPFSFFNKIVLSEKNLPYPNLDIIISHEHIHVKEKHTLDILFTEILFILQWFNPFAWLIKDAVKNNLEYKTDHQVTQKYNPQTYQLTMVALADKKSVAPFLTALNGSQLKNRIIMMKKNTENKFAIVRQLVILPLLAVLVMGLSNREVKTEIAQNSLTISKDSIETNQSIIIKGKVTNQNGIPISGASITVKGKTLGTITDSGGNYEIRLDNDNEILVYSVQGDVKKEVNVTGKSVINVKADYVTVKDVLYGDPALAKNKEKKYEVSGKVTNEKGDPLNGAAVIIKGTTSGTITDNSGNYQIGTNEDVATLVFSMIGYEVKEASVNGDKKLNIKLKTDKDAKPGEIKVTGYGYQNQQPVKSKIKLADENGNLFEPTVQPLLIVDDIETESIAGINPDCIESIDVLKGETGTDVYGEKGKNGVVLITTKNLGKPKPEITTGNPIIIVDGQVYDSIEGANIPPEEIASVSVLKNETASTKIYGDRAKNGVIIINTKTKYNSDKPEPLIVINGKETDKIIKDIAPETIESVNIVKGDKAIEKYGNKGKNGVIEVTLKKTVENTEIKSILDLRKFIAKEIRYPFEAQKNNYEATVEMWGVIKENGEVSSIIENEPKGKFVNIDEVVVAAYKNSETKNNIEMDYKATLKEEVKRVINKLPTVEMPELMGKTVAFRIKFILQ